MIQPLANFANGTITMTVIESHFLHPLSVDEFMRTTWEKRHRLIVRNTPGFHSPLISIQEIERYLATENVFFPGVQAVHNNKDIHWNEYADDAKQVEPQRLKNSYAAGATVVMSMAHKHFPELAKLCRSVTQSLQMRCQTNLYLSPAGNQGFRSHYDTHDVFILQVSGTKTFRFYPSDVKLPFPDDQYDSQQNPHTEVTDSVTLSAGDTLYIPRGLVHDAVAHPDEPSLHITLGVFAVVLRDVLQEAIQVASEGYVSLRQSAMGGDFHSGIRNDSQFKDWSRLISDEMLDESWSRLNDRLAIDSDLSVEVNLLDKPTLSEFTEVEWIPENVLNSERCGEQLKLRLFGQVVTVTEPMSTAVEALQTQGRIQLSSLPGLEPDQQMALCTHLYEVGVISVQPLKTN